MSFLFPEEITTGVVTIDDGLITMSGTSFAAQLDPLDPARDWTLNLTIRTASALTGAAVFAFQGEPWAPTGTLNGQSHTWTFDSELAPILEVSGLTQGATLTVEIEQYGLTDGPGRLAVLAYTPRRDFQSAILGQAILGSFQLPKPDAIRPWFILGESYLGYGTLPQGSSFNTWYSFIDDGLTVETTRAMNWNGFTTTGEVGTAAITFLNAHDPRSSNLRRNTPIIVLDCSTRRALFTGIISKASSTQEKDGTYRVTITAIDKIGEAAKVTKWQETRDGQAVWWTLGIDQLLASFPHTITTINPASSRPTIGDMVKESTLVQWIDIYAATAGVHWWTDRRNTIQFRDEPPTEPLGAITALGQAPADLPALHATDAAANWDTDQLSATLEATNNTAAYDLERGEWTGSTTTVRATNTTLEASYGPSTMSIETAAADPTALQAHLAERVKNYTPRQVMTGAQFRPWDARLNHLHGEQITRLVDLDLMDPITATYRSETTTLHITGIKHTITPLEWSTSLDLSQLRKDQ